MLSFALIALLPVDQWLLRPLEDRFPVPADLAKVDGIVVLGGAINATLAADRGRPALNSAADRLTEFAILARTYPAAKLVFSGGPPPNDPAGPREADFARILFEGLGIDGGRLQYEAQSRTTWENAQFSKALVKPAEGEVWLLVTSAFQMPRAVGAFRASGLDLLPYPVGHKTYRGNEHEFGSLTARLRLLDVAMHEWVGLAYYRFQGRSSALFPALNPAPPGSFPAHTADDPPPG